MIYYYRDKYYIKSAIVNKEGHVIYSLPKCIYDSEQDKWIVKKHTCYVGREVVNNFIVNNDIQENRMIWHRDNDRLDNYYKHLYPMNKGQYYAIKKIWKHTGRDDDATILNVLNDLRFKPEDWAERYQKRTLCGVGYVGKKYESVSQLPAYRRWSDMINRCYNKRFHERQPQYEECSVSPEWHNFSNFKVWYDSHYYEIDGETMDLDKDILFKGNKVYSVETGCIVPHNINGLFLSSRKGRGAFPIGVSYDVSKKKFIACFAFEGRSIKAGAFSTPEEAFAIYELNKETLIQAVASDYKEKIPHFLYDALICWKIEITD